MSSPSCPKPRPRPKPDWHGVPTVGATARCRRVHSPPREALCRDVPSPGETWSRPDGRVASNYWATWGVITITLLRVR